MQRGRLSSGVYLRYVFCIRGRGEKVLSIIGLIGGRMTPEEKLSAGIVNAHRGQQVTGCGIGRTITVELKKYRENVRKQCFRQMRQSIITLLTSLEEME